MTPTTSSTCPSCGGAVLPDDRFCGNCGTPAASARGASEASATTRLGPFSDKAAGPFADTSPWGVVASRLQAATLGEFEIVTELGRGGMAAVYLARDLALNRRVALKVMAPGLLLGPGMVERFRQEAVTVANLQHAHIVSIHAVRQIEDLHFFVMQFVPGRTLEGVLREGGTLPIAVVRAWLYQMGSALGYAHRRGVIHRDVKPGNILLNADGEAIVTDFGIAKVAESPSHTQTGTVVGTPVYMSPEQCFAKELTGASDQYSLGVVAYEMLAGRPPFTGSSFALMRAHTDDPPPPLSSARADVPPTMEAALMRMLAKKPEERFATLAEALVSLGAAPLSPDDPLHTSLQNYAAAGERLELLGDIIRTPASPVPQTRERPQVTPAAPKIPAPATHTLVVVLAHPPSDLEPGATAMLRATVRNAGGESVPGTALHWTSGDSSIVTVDPRTGALTAIARGSTVVSVIAGTARDSIDVVVGEPKAANIIVSIPRGQLTTGDRVAVSAVVTSRYGVRVTRPVDWSVDEPSIAVVERGAKSTGPATLRGVSPGATGVIASCDGAIGRSSIRVDAPVVVPAPPVATPSVETAAAATAAIDAVPRQPVPAAATVPSARVGAPVGVPVAPPRANTLWRWAVPAVAALGVVAYLALKPSATTPPGGTSVVARDSNRSVAADTLARSARDSTRKTDTSSVASRQTDTTASTRADSSVAPPAASAAVARRIEVRPAKSDAILPGQTISLSARVRDASGAVMDGARVVWASSDSRVATVDPTQGVVRGVGAGATRITARVGSVVSAVVVTVLPPPPDPTVVASIDVSDVRPMTVGDSARVAATARNASGAPVPSAVVEWTLSNPNVASVASNGTITARSAGTATIRAASGGRATDRSVTVRAREVVTRVDTPATGRTSTPPAKSEAELRNEIQDVLRTYARAIQTRDTSLIRRVFPNAGGELMTRWQTTFDDARAAIQMTGEAIEILDTPRDAAGAQVHARARYMARFSSRAARSDQTFPVAFDAVLERQAGTWRITSIR